MFSAPKPFEANRIHLRSGHDVDVNDRRRLLARTVQHPRGVTRHRPAQIARARPFADAVVDGLLHTAAGPVHVLPDLEHHHGNAAVLADRPPLGGGYFVIANKLLQRSTAERRFFAIDRVTQRLQDVGRDVVVGLHDQPCHGVAQHRDVDLADG